VWGWKEGPVAGAGSAVWGGAVRGQVWCGRQVEGGEPVQGGRCSVQCGAWCGEQCVRCGQAVVVQKEGWHQGCRQCAAVAVCMC